MNEVASQIEWIKWINGWTFFAVLALSFLSFFVLFLTVRRALRVSFSLCLAIAVAAAGLSASIASAWAVFKGKDGIVAKWQLETAVPFIVSLPYVSKEVNIVSVGKKRPGTELRPVKAVLAGSARETVLEASVKVSPGAPVSARFKELSSDLGPGFPKGVYFAEISVPEIQMSWIDNPAEMPASLPQDQGEQAGMGVLFATWCVASLVYLIKCCYAASRMSQRRAEAPSEMRIQRERDALLRDVGRLENENKELRDALKNAEARAGEETRSPRVVRS